MLPRCKAVKTVEPEPEPETTKMPKNAASGGRLSEPCAAAAVAVVSLLEPPMLATQSAGRWRRRSRSAAGRRRGRRGVVAAGEDRAAQEPEPSCSRSQMAVGIAVLRDHAAGTGAGAESWRSSQMAEGNQRNVAVSEDHAAGAGAQWPDDGEGVTVWV